MLSRRGECRAFDALADGFVPGEGVGVVVLKPLARALADGDHVYGVIAGSGINQDGRTNGLTAPSGRAQERLEREVYARCGIDPASIGYVETHGTGTRLGDPIEVAALTAAFGSGVGRGACALGSVKSNIGHTLTAAGIAGLLKVLLGLQRGELFASLHFEEGNEEIEWERSPFYVNTRLRRWEPVGGSSVRRAAVSSFGFSGTNCHVVVEEAPGVARAAAPGARLIVLSGRSAAAVRQRRRDLLEWLEGAGAGASLADLSYTLGAGRSHFAWRLWWVVEDLAELHAELSADCEPERAAVSEEDAREPASGHDRAGLLALGSAYGRGARLDWAGLFAGEAVRRLPLPGYPFERKRYWAARMPGDGKPGAAAHPGAAVRAEEPAGPTVASSVGLEVSSPVSLLVKRWERAPEPGRLRREGHTVVLAVGDVVPAAELAGFADWTLVGDAAAQAALGAGRFYALDAASAASGATVAAALADLPVAGVIDLMDVDVASGAADRDAVADATSGVPWGRIVLLQDLLRRGTVRRLLHVSRASQGLGVERARLAGTLMRSLVLAAGQEERVLAASVDCEAGMPLPLARLIESADEGEVVYHAGARYVRRLCRAAFAAGEGFRVSAERPCVISGGSGDLGRTLAEHVVRQGVRRVVLLGRRARAQAAETIAALEQAGAAVKYYGGALSDAPLREFLAREVEPDWGARYGGVLHCAGRVPRLGRFVERSWEEMAATLEPKVSGTDVLWRLLGDRTDCFVLFSSVSNVARDAGGGSCRLRGRECLSGCVCAGAPGRGGAGGCARLGVVGGDGSLGGSAGAALSRRARDPCDEHAAGAGRVRAGGGERCRAGGDQPDGAGLCGAGGGI